MITTDNTATLANAIAEIERLKSELSHTDVLLEECKMDWSGDVMQIKAEHKHEIERLKNEAVAADIRIGNDAMVIERLNSELETLSKIAGLASVERDAYKASAEEQVELVLTIAAERDALRAALQAVLHDVADLDMFESNEPGRDKGPWEMATEALAMGDQS